MNKKLCNVETCHPASGNSKSPSPAVAFCNSVSQYVCGKHVKTCKNRDHNWRDLNDEERGGN